MSWRGARNAADKWQSAFLSRKWADCRVERNFTWRAGSCILDRSPPRLEVSLSFSIGVQPLVLLCDFDNLKLANSRFSLLNFVNCIFFWYKFLLLWWSFYLNSGIHLYGLDKVTQSCLQSVLIPSELVTQRVHAIFLRVLCIFCRVVNWSWD